MEVSPAHDLVLTALKFTDTTAATSYKQAMAR